MIIMTVYDSKAKYYLKPFFVAQRGEGIRSFIAACNEPGHQFYDYSEDFTLYEIGQFDPISGTVVSHKDLEPIGRAWELKHVQSAQNQGDDLPLISEMERKNAN